MAAAALAILPAHLTAQTRATLDVGGSYVQYDGFLASGAAAVSPTWQFDDPRFSAGLQGTWVLFESGNSIFQGTAAAAWLSPPTGRWHLELSGSLGASKYSDANTYGHALARVRVHLLGARSGAWLSLGTGWTMEETTTSPLEITAGGWTVYRDFAVAGTLTSTVLPGIAYLDAVATTRWTTGRIEVESQLGVRPWSSDRRALEREVYGEVAVTAAIAGRLSAIASAGHSPFDLARAVLGADYVNIGVQIGLFRRPTRPLSTIAGALVRVADELSESGFASTAALEIDASGTTRTVRVRVTRARSVEVMGDFTDWEPVSLTPAGPDTWETQLPVGPGAHRLNIRINGGPWLVPLGTRLEETEFGTAVGVIVIP